MGVDRCRLKRGASWLLVVLCACSLPMTAAADDSTMPDSAVVHRNVSVMRYNPLGLQNEYRIGWRKRLSDSDHLLLRETYFTAGLQAMVTPAMHRVGPRIDFKPLAVLHLYAMAEWVWYMGNFQFMQSHPDANVNFSDTAQKAAAKRDENHAATGWSLNAGALVQAKVGPIAVRSNNRLLHTTMATKDDQPIWHDIYLDLLMPRKGWALSQDNDILWLNDRLIVGVRHTWSRSWLPDVAGATSERSTTHRVGPFVAWRLTAEERYANSMLRRPTLVVLSQWWLAHPYRTGQDVSQATPWLVVALSFDGRLPGD